MPPWLPHARRLASRSLDENLELPLDRLRSEKAEAERSAACNPRSIPWTMTHFGKYSRPSAATSSWSASSLCVRSSAGYGLAANESEIPPARTASAAIRHFEGTDMPVRRFISNVNPRDVMHITNGTIQLRIPSAVPPGAVEAFQRRLRDRLTRPLAWKRRQARENLRLYIREARGRVPRKHQ